MAKTTSLAIILAAGEGTRMRSARPKVLHEIGNLPMLGHVLAATGNAGLDRRAVVIGPGHDASQAFVNSFAPDATVRVQKERRGTAHAVLAARSEIGADVDKVIVLYGDTPFIAPRTLKRLQKRLAGGDDVVVLGFRPSDPAGYGRLITEGRRLVAIREVADATRDELDIGFCNSGVVGMRGEHALKLLKAVGKNNAQGEYYLTDVVEIAHELGLVATALEIAPDEVLGINSRKELAAAEAVFQARARDKAMAGGVTMTDPSTVWFSHDTKLGRDITIEPNVVFGPGVQVGNNVTIRAHCHLTGARLRDSAQIGPFARLRPGTTVGRDARVGNFVEVKNADIGEGAKMGHLSYIGDATIGAAANIGAGTITCNYDGFLKHRTEIGPGAFVGSNSSLVAPVRIGKSSYVASGSVISSDVEDEALAIARQRQVDKPGWVIKFQRLMANAKSGRGKP